MTDETYLRKTFDLAFQAFESGSRPFAALIVFDGQIICETLDERKWKMDPTAHPEVEAIRTFYKRFDLDQINRAALYTNVEPCPMCAGAIFYSGIGRLVYSVSRKSFDSWVAQCRMRPRQRCVGAREIIRPNGLTRVRGPLLEKEGLALIKHHFFPLRFEQEKTGTEN
ncbi:MAG: nucleoside deaminase [Acidobacteriota bacterium]|nr:nucleoside deaminase [Acidobacteriota bacterium]